MSFRHRRSDPATLPPAPPPHTVRILFDPAEVAEAQRRAAEADLELAHRLEARALAHGALVVPGALAAVPDRPDGVDPSGPPGTVAWSGAG